MINNKIVVGTSNWHYTNMFDQCTSTTFKALFEKKNNYETK